MAISDFIIEILALHYSTYSTEKCIWKLVCRWVRASLNQKSWSWEILNKSYES